MAKYGASQIAVTSASCELIAATGSNYAILTCRLPYLTVVPAFSSFSATVAQAEAAAITAAGMPASSLVTSYRYYEFPLPGAPSGTPQARHVSIVFDGHHVGKSVLLDGGTTTLQVSDANRSFAFNGWANDFPLGVTNGFVAPSSIAVGAGQTTTFDTAAFNSSAIDNCLDSHYPHGMVVCDNDAAVFAGLPAHRPGVLSTDEYTVIANFVKPTARGPAPAIPLSGDPGFAGYSPRLVVYSTRTFRRSTWPASSSTSLGC